MKFQDPNKNEMIIRTATMDDLQDITEIEAACFPAAEAADRKSFERRLTHFADHFWVLMDEDVMVGFVNGMVTDEKDLRDEMYDDASLHNPKGAWQMIFGVDTLPAYRRQGCAEKVLKHVIESARKEGRKGLVLTCKDHMVHYYSKFGFVKEGVSDSTHGGVLWYQMRLTF